MTLAALERREPFDTYFPQAVPLLTGLVEAPGKRQLGTRALAGEAREPNAPELRSIPVMIGCRRFWISGILQLTWYWAGVFGKNLATPQTATLPRPEL